MEGYFEQIVDRHEGEGENQCLDEDGDEDEGDEGKKKWGTEFR